MKLHMVCVTTQCCVTYDNLVPCLPHNLVFSTVSLVLLSSQPCECKSLLVGTQLNLSHSCSNGILITKNKAAKQNCHKVLLGNTILLLPVGGKVTNTKIWYESKKLSYELLRGTETEQKIAQLIILRIRSSLKEKTMTTNTD